MLMLWACLVLPPGSAVQGLLPTELDTAGLEGSYSPSGRTSHCAAMHSTTGTMEFPTQKTNIGFTAKSV